MEALFGLKFLTKTGTTDLQAVLKHDFVLTYFSASWCPPCQAFTPVLRSFYNTVNSPVKRLEVLFVSRDQDEASFKSYFKQMPWLALDYSDQERIQGLLSKYQVKTIPTLLLLNKDGSEAHRECRREVEASGVKILPVWQSKLASRSK